MIDFEPLPLAGAYLLRHRQVTDDRGSFQRLYCRDTFQSRGLETAFPQQNLSTCHKRGVLRGLHYQIPPAGEAKLLHCIRGAVYDVMVDMRKGSPTYLRWYGCELRENQAISVYIPAYFAHGYQALEHGSAVVYHASSPYAPEHERQIRYDDPRIGVRWPIIDPILSQKDCNIPSLPEDFAGIEL